MYFCRMFATYSSHIQLSVNCHERNYKCKTFSCTKPKNKILLNKRFFKQCIISETVKYEHKRLYVETKLNFKKFLVSKQNKFHLRNREVTV